MDGDAARSVQFEQAVTLHRQGRVEDAARGYEQILQANPNHVDTLIHLGSLRAGQGRTAEAEGLLQRATAIAPDSPEALANLAAVVQAQGRLPDAAIHYHRAIGLRPDMLDAHFGLAGCLQAMGRGEEAVACYAAVLRAEPAHPEANYGLATLLAGLGRTDEAIVAFRAALAADPDFAEASLGLGHLLARGGALVEAADCFRQALDVDPGYTEARMELASALARLDRYDEAMTAFQAVVADDPGHAEAHNGIGILLDRKQRHGEAADHYRAALERQPDHFDAMMGLANALKNVGRHHEALPLARQGLGLRPDSATGRSLLGSILAEIGQTKEAEAEFRRAVALEPTRPQFGLYLTQVAKIRPGDEALTALEAMLAHAPSYSVEDQWLLHFALAKAYDDIGERDRGFDHLLKANRLKRSSIEYHETVALEAMDRLAAVFSADLFASRAGLGDPSAAPVFIVGMPRSGTTLIEQMLASHHAVFGAGERPEITDMVKRLGADRIGTVSFPELAWILGEAEFRRLGAEYAVAIRTLAPEAKRIVDKMPGNFLFVGLIHLILPNARIIHAVRDPVDTCLSCFSKLFGDVQKFSYELGELGRYHHAYQRLMGHWRRVLPPGVMVEVEYEALVDDFETEARRIVTHCGLEWDSVCLEFYKSSRPVSTASMSQVRQPVYKSSVGRWRPNPEFLRPLLGALESR